MVATGTALLIGAGLAAGSQVAGAAMQSHAAGNAAESQERSAHEALELQREMYQQRRTDLQPYMASGAAANTTLSQLMGLGTPQAAAAPATGLPAPRPVPVPTPEQFASGSQRGIPRDMSGRTTGPIRLDDWRELRNAQYGATHQNASGYVQLRSPDGHTSQVPVDQVDHYLQRGATRV
jgi:hypothetical protein